MSTNYSGLRLNLYYVGSENHREDIKRKLIEERRYFENKATLNPSEWKFLEDYKDNVNLNENDRKFLTETYYNYIHYKSLYLNTYYAVYDMMQVVSMQIPLYTPENANKSKEKISKLNIKKGMLIDIELIITFMKSKENKFGISWKVSGFNINNGIYYYFSVGDKRGENLDLYVGKKIHIIGFVERDYVDYTIPKFDPEHPEINDPKFANLTENKGTIFFKPLRTKTAILSIEDYKKWKEDEEKEAQVDYEKKKKIYLNAIEILEKKMEGKSGEKKEYYATQLDAFKSLLYGYDEKIISSALKRVKSISDVEILFEPFNFPFVIKLTSDEFNLIRIEYLKYEKEKQEAKEKKIQEGKAKGRKEKTKFSFFEKDFKYDWDGKVSLLNIDDMDELLLILTHLKKLPLNAFLQNQIDNIRKYRKFELNNRFELFALQSELKRLMTIKNLEKDLDFIFGKMVNAEDAMPYILFNNEYSNTIINEILHRNEAKLKDNPYADEKTSEIIKAGIEEALYQNYLDHNSKIENYQDHEFSDLNLLNNQGQILNLQFFDFHYEKTRNWLINTSLISQIDEFRFKIEKIEKHIKNPFLIRIKARYNERNVYIIIENKSPIVLYFQGTEEEQSELLITNYLCLSWDIQVIKELESLTKLMIDLGITYRNIKPYLLFDQSNYEIEFEGDLTKKILFRKYQEGFIIYVIFLEAFLNDVEFNNNINFFYLNLASYINKIPELNIYQTNYQDHLFKFHQKFNLKTMPEVKKEEEMKTIEVKKEEAKPKKEIEQLKGGLADKTLDSNFDQKQLAIGMNIELEHTNPVENKNAIKTIKEITKDHLIENSNYYSELLQLEKRNKPEDFILSKQKLIDFQKILMQLIQNKESKKDIYLLLDGFEIIYQIDPKVKAIISLWIEKNYK